MSGELNRQIVVRVKESTYDALVEDAERNGRTVAQSVRFQLRRLPITEGAATAALRDLLNWTHTQPNMVPTGLYNRCYELVGEP